MLFTGLQNQCSQLQQQQLLMGLNHCYYQMLQQQQQLIERVSLLESHLVHDTLPSRSPRSLRPFDLGMAPEPFDSMNDRLLTTAPMPRKVAPKRSPLSDIPIETIQARNSLVEDDLRLNLDEAVVRPKKQRSPKTANKPSQASSQDGERSS